MALDTHRFVLTIELVGRTAAHLDNAVPALAAGGWRLAALPGAAPRASMTSPVLSLADLAAVQEMVRAVRATGARADAAGSIDLRIDAVLLDARARGNLRNLLDKQGELLARVLGRSLDQVGPRPCKGSPFAKGAVALSLPATLHTGELAATIVLMLAIVQRAISARATSSKRRPFDPTSAKYDFRCFLLRLGLLGESYRSAREQLLKRLSGSAAWKRGRPPRPERASRPRMPWVDTEQPTP